MTIHILRKWATTVLLAIFTALLAGCGGGGGAGAGTVAAAGGDSGVVAGAGGSVSGGGGAGAGTTVAGGDGGIGGTGISYGGITAFGSVWVNGVEFNTSTAVFKLDGNTVTQSALRVGMVVLVDGSVTAKTALDVTVDEALKGRVEQVIDANQMVVMGQLVRIDNLTQFENHVVPVAGDIAHVHGLVVADGIVGAGYIEKQAVAGAPPFAVKGFVKNHNAGAQTLVIGTLTVSYAGADVSDMPAGSWNGKVVQVKGTACAGAPVCGTLTASKVAPNGPQVSNISEAEFEGFVTATTGNGFVLGAQTVVTNASTVYQNGVAADAVLGARLEVEGAIAGGVFTASKVSFRDDVRLEADVASVNSSQITLAGLPGVAVQFNALTVFKGKSGINAISGLMATHHLRIRGRASGATVEATEVELRSTSSDSRVTLQGPTTRVAAPSLSVMGVVIDTAPVADSEFKGLGGGTVGRSTFFNSLAVGDTLKAQGTLTGASVVWDQLERED